VEDPVGDASDEEGQEDAKGERGAMEEKSDADPPERVGGAGGGIGGPPGGRAHRAAGGMRRGVL
jgi:hypothetical protein